MTGDDTDICYNLLMRRPGYLAGFDDYGVTGKEVNRLRKMWARKKARRRRHRERPGLAKEASWISRSRQRRAELVEEGEEELAKEKKGWFRRLFG